MPWTLYRYILFDLLRVVAAALLALVAVLSFAAAIKPLADGLLGPWGLVRFVLLIAPWMLGIALPFAGGFAATVVLLRMTRENEVLAALAGGMSHAALLAPAWGVALLLAGGQLVISHGLVPSFYRQAQLLLDRDLLEVIVRRVEDGRPVTFQNWVVYADGAEVAPAPQLRESGAQPDRLISLEGVALGRLGPDGRMRHRATCAEARMFLFRSGRDRWVTMRLQDAVRVQRERGALERVGAMTIPAVRLPDPVEADPEFMTLTQLRAAEADPTEHPPVARARRRLVGALAAGRAAKRAARRMREGAVALEGPSAQRYRVSAPRVERVGARRLRLEATEEQPVRLVYQEEGLITRRARAARGALVFRTREPDVAPRVAPRLAEVTMIDTRHGGARTQRRQWELPESRLPWDAAAGLRAESPESLLAEVGEGAADAVRSAAAGLRRQMGRLERALATVHHQRGAQALAGLLTVMLGTLAALGHGSKTVLVVYLRVFILALLAVLTIHGSENLATAHGGSATVGLGLIWSGDALLLLASGVAYWRVRRGE